MNLKQDIKPITYMKTHASQLIKMVQETRHPVVITQNGEARAVLQDVESYEKTRQAVLMLKLLVQGETEITKGNVLRHEEVMGGIEERLKSQDSK